MSDRSNFENAYYEKYREDGFRGFTRKQLFIREDVSGTYIREGIERAYHMFNAALEQAAKVCDEMMLLKAAFAIRELKGE